MELIGHATVLSQLSTFGGNAVLLVGPARVGKRTIARMIAALLNCEQATSVPCGRCFSCLSVWRSTHPDLLEVEPKSLTASGKVARKRIIPVAAITAKRDDGHEYAQHVTSFIETAPRYRRKVVIIDGAEFLSEEAANALLKMIEEPPYQALFVFIAEEGAAVLPTILSRSSRVDVLPVPAEELVSYTGKPELLAFAAGRPGILIQREQACAALEDAHLLVEGLHGSLLTALTAVESFEKRFDPLWHKEALQFVLRGEDLFRRSRIDLALEQVSIALEQYVSPSLVFQWLALELRMLLKEH